MIYKHLHKICLAKKIKKNILEENARFWNINTKSQGHDEPEKKENMYDQSLKCIIQRIRNNKEIKIQN